MTSVKSRNSDTQSNRDMPFDGRQEMDSSPTEDAKDEVEHEEGPDHDEGDEVDDVESVAHGVVELRGKKNERRL